MSYMNLIISSLIIELILLLIVLYSCRKFGFVSYPKIDRWHNTPRALHGGVSMFFTLLVVAYSSYFLQSHPLLFFSYFLIFSVGFFDDIFNLKPSIKLIFQTVSIFFLLYGYREFANFNLTIFHLCFYFLMTLVLTNSVNLLDNMDGLASGIVFATSNIIYLYARMSNDKTLLFLSLSVSLINLVFLLFNFKPAKIFMGDSGSLFLGLIISTYVISFGSNGSFSVKSILAIFSLVMVPLLDTTMVFFRRILSGRRFTQGGKDHLSHRLVVYGFNDVTSVLILIGSTYLWGLISLLLFYFNGLLVYLIFILFFIITLYFLIKLVNLNIYNEEEEMIFSRRISILSFKKS
jgi:UDP-GlcNAc:undecaprenyl-phosphate GlcNAc-1-phosphate transferase